MYPIKASRGVISGKRRFAGVLVKSHAFEIPLKRGKLIILKFNIYVKFYVAPKVHSRATEGLQ